MPPSARCAVTRDMGKAATISVAMCTCNGSMWVREQLMDILAQSRQVDELIICDDASDDDTVDVVKRMLDSFEREARLIRNPRRLGVTKNFEQAISSCTGEIIFLADQDDRWAISKVDRMSAVFDDPSVKLVTSNAQVVDELGRPLGYTMFDSTWFNPREREMAREGNLLDVVLKHAVVAGTTMAFRADLRPILLPIPDLPACHDMWIALLVAAMRDARVAVIEDCLMSYRLHGRNTVGIRKFDLRGQIAMAKRQLASGAFEFGARLHEAALERLGALDRAALRKGATEKINAKVAHCRRRHGMSHSLVGRVGAITGEALRGNYGRFSYGWKSVLQDLFLR